MIQLVPAETFIGHNSTFLYLLGVFFWLNANEMSGYFQHNLSQSCDPYFNNNKTGFFKKRIIKTDKRLLRLATNAKSKC